MPASFSIDNVKAIGLSNFDAGIGEVSSSWERFFNWHEGNTPIKRLNAIHGIGLIPEKTGQGLTPVELDKANTHDVGYRKYGVQVRVDRLDLEETPELGTLIPRIMGRSVAATYQAVGHEALGASFTAVVDLGGKPMIALDHPTSLGGVRPNKVASGFDRAAFMATYALAEKWVDYNEISANFTAGGFNLAINANARTAAFEALGSDVSSSEMQANVAKGLADWSVEDVFDDDGDFLLVSKTNSPYHMYERSAPEYDNRTAENDPKMLLFMVDFALGSGISPTPDGVIGGKA